MTDHTDPAATLFAALSGLATGCAFVLVGKLLQLAMIVMGGN